MFFNAGLHPGFVLSTLAVYVVQELEDQSRPGTACFQCLEFVV